MASTAMTHMLYTEVEERRKRWATWRKCLSETAHVCAPGSPCRFALREAWDCCMHKSNQIGSGGVVYVVPKTTDLSSWVNDVRQNGVRLCSPPCVDIILKMADVRRRQQVHAVRAMVDHSREAAVAASTR